MNSFDISVYHWFNQHAGSTPILDPIMSIIAQYALEFYILLFIVAWFTLPKDDTHKRHGLVVAGCSGILALIINVIIGHIWVRPRPFTVLHSFHQIIPHSADASFPSDHTSGAFAFASATWGRSQKWLSRTFTILAVVLMIARVYVGVHWPTDVLASVVVGIISSQITWRLEKLLRPLTQLGLRIFKYGKYATQTNS